MTVGRGSGGSLAGMVLLLVAVGLAAIGCASVGSTMPSGKLPASQTAADGVFEEVVQVASGEDASDRPLTISVTKEWNPEREIEEYDPLQPFNENVFSFNRQFDRFILKPAATAYDWVIPNPVRRSIKNAFDNLGMPRRVVNNLLQAKFRETGRELARFLINTTVGVAGLFDVAKAVFVLEKSDEDTGQTLGVWGVGHGPYLILPLLPPLSVRDGVGAVVDLALDPLNYVLPVAALGGMTAGKTVNERSVNLELYENVEETVLDLYSAVRNAYLQRRQRAIEE